MKRSLFNKLSLLLCLVLFSCKYDLVEQPTLEPDVVLNASDYANEITFPSNLTATQGGCKKITLSWNTLPNAIQYQIFAAETPFETFIQVGETPDNSNEFEVTEKAGTTKYYAVKAVNYYGTVSSLSNVVMGSTLANPVITSIESGSNGTTSTVKWWMENCNLKTYQSSVQYIITCYKEDRVTVVDSKNAAGNETSVSFSNLEPHTNYFYQVEAFLSSAQDDEEKSDMLDAETARRLIPRAPVGFTATQGLSSDKIELTWKLPEFVDVSLGTNSFEQHPIYFTIERKLASEDETKFIKIVSYLGTIQADDDTTKDNNIKFSCAASTTTSTNLILNTAEADDATVQYPDYKPGTLITYTDTTAKAGLKYTYRITSFTDDTNKTISSEDSIVTAEGWKIGNVSFFATARYTDDPENDELIKSAKINFDINFEPFGVEYKYYIVEQRTAFATGSTPDTPTIIQTYNTLEQLKAFSKDFTEFPLDVEGEYKYSLIITKATATSSTDAIVTIPCFGKVIVAAEKTKLPHIAWFTVEDGFKDKFILSWDYLENYTYKFKFVPSGADENSITPELITDFQNSNNIATFCYVPTVENAKGRFILLATPNVDNPPTEEISLTNEYSVLGKAVPQIESYDYDKIKVTWQQVQHTSGDVDDYSVEAYFDSEAGNFANSENTTITKEGETYTCIITNPKGYNDYSRSGKPIQLKVKSQSSNQTDSTTAIKEVRTLGPALTDVKVEGSTADDITISWKQVEGTDSYIVYRPKYSYEDFNIIERADKYFVKKSGNSYVAEIDGSSDGVNATVTLSNGRFTLKDKYKADDSNGTSSYKANQAELSWGIPFGYIVIPAKSTDDFIFNTNSTTLDSSSKVKYNSISEKKAATYGYARNLTAEKAANGTIQKLTWDKPYNSTRTPYVFRRESGTNGTWEYVEAAKTGTQTTSTGFEIENEEDLTKAYDYVVRYNTSSSTDMAQSYLNKIETKKDSLSPTEALNKGYLLNINFKVEPGFASSDTSSDANYYRIRISWQNWDSSKKAVCPTSASIEALNKNLADGWKLVYSLDSNCKPVSKGSLSQTNFDTSDDLIYLSPVFTDNLSNGQLKVLRDIKQYFCVKLQSPNGTANFGTDESIYTYRQITEDELCRCVGLIIADTLYQTGIPYKTVTGSKSRTLTGASGKFTITGSPKDAFDYKNYVSWGFSSNYKHIFNNGTSSKYQDESTKTFISSFILDSSDRSCAHELGIAGDITPTGNTLYHLPSLSITITNTECSLPTYNGTYSISVGQEGNSTKWNLSFGNNISFSNNENKFKSLFPYKIGEEHENGDTSLNTKFLIYQSPFWN